MTHLPLTQPRLITQTNHLDKDRCHAIVVILRAFLTGSTTLVLLGTMIAEYVFLACSLSYLNVPPFDRGSIWTVAATTAILTGVLLVAVYIAGIVVMVYRTTKRSDHELWRLDHNGAEAYIILIEDHHKTAQDGDVQAYGLAAWPKGRDAGKAMGRWAVEHVHRSGGTLVCTAFSVIAARYVSEGNMIDVGRRGCLPFIRRLRSRPPATTQTRQTEQAFKNQAGEGEPDASR